MAVKDINAKSWALSPSADEWRHSAFQSGNAPSGGTAALSWVAPEGIAVGKRLMLMSDGTHNLVLPNRHRFTGFSQSSATEGAAVALEDTDFVEIQTGARTPKYSGIARGQGRSIDLFQLDVDSYQLCAAGNSFEELATEVFVSYALHIPATSYLPFALPEQDPGGPGLWPGGSMAKFVWLLDSTGDKTNTDLVILLTNSGSAELTGNGLTYPPLRNLGQMTDFFRFDKWNRISTWIKCGADPNVDNGSMWFDALNTVDSAFNRSSYSAPIFGAQPEPQGWGKINWGGWSRTRPTKDCEMLYTDMYVAYGANAAARLEVGNASTYAGCSDRAICVPVKRHHSKMTEYSIERGGIDLSGDSWLYYVDGNNTPTLVGKFT